MPKQQQFTRQIYNGNTQLGRCLQCSQGLSMRRMATAMETRNLDAGYVHTCESVKRRRVARSIMVVFVVPS